jgi:hypothetical protein
VHRLVHGLPIILGCISEHTIVSPALLDVDNQYIAMSCVFSCALLCAVCLVQVVLLVKALSLQLIQDIAIMGIGNSSPLG